LSTITKQAGWSLVVTAPESSASRPLSIQASKKPAGEVLELLREAGALRASFADGLLRGPPPGNLEMLARAARPTGERAWCSANL